MVRASCYAHSAAVVGWVSRCCLRCCTLRWQLRCPTVTAACNSPSTAPATTSSPYLHMSPALPSPLQGDALYAMELALSLEKLNFQKLRELHDVADKCGDAQMCDFVEGALLAEQVEAVKQTAEYVSQLRRVGKGLGVYQFDKELGAAVAAAANAAA